LNRDAGPPFKKSGRKDGMMNDDENMEERKRGREEEKRK
jgi:hypothetical protein